MHAEGTKHARESAAVSDRTKISCVRKVGELRIRKLSAYEIFWIYSIYRLNYTQTELYTDRWTEYGSMKKTRWCWGWEMESGKRKSEMTKKGREWKEDLWRVVEREVERERERERNRMPKNSILSMPKNSFPYHSECKRHHQAIRRAWLVNKEVSLDHDLVEDHFFSVLGGCCTEHRSINTGKTLRWPDTNHIIAEHFDRKRKTESFLRYWQKHFINQKKRQFLMYL